MTARVGLGCSTGRGARARCVSHMWTRGLLRLPHTRPPRSARVTHSPTVRGASGGPKASSSARAAMAWTRAAAVDVAASQGCSRRRASGWRGRVRSVGCSIKRQWMHIRDACMHETCGRHISIAWQRGRMITEGEARGSFRRGAQMHDEMEQRVWRRGSRPRPVLKDSAGPRGTIRPL